MASEDETNLEKWSRKIRQDKDRVRAFVSAWRARPFLARKKFPTGQPVTVTRDHGQWRVTYYAESFEEGKGGWQPAGSHNEKSFAAAVSSALKEHGALLDTAVPFVDPGAKGERVLERVDDLIHRAKADEGFGATPYSSPRWQDVIEAFEVAADAFEEVGHTFRADSIRRHITYLETQMSRGRAPFPHSDRDRQGSGIRGRDRAVHGPAAQAWQGSGRNKKRSARDPKKPKTRSRSNVVELFSKPPKPKKKRAAPGGLKRALELHDAARAAGTRALHSGSGQDSSFWAIRANEDASRAYAAASRAYIAIEREAPARLLHLTARRFAATAEYFKKRLRTTGRDRPSADSLQPTAKGARRSAARPRSAKARQRRKGS